MSKWFVRNRKAPHSPWEADGQCVLTLAGDASGSYIQRFSDVHELLSVRSGCQPCLAAVVSAGKPTANYVGVVIVDLFAKTMLPGLFVDSAAGPCRAWSSLDVMMMLFVETLEPTHAWSHSEKTVTVRHGLIHT